MANRNIYNLGMYTLSCVAGAAGWFYYQSENKNLSVEEKYEKFGGDKQRLVEQRVQNALMFKKIKERAGIKEEELPVKKPEAPVLRMEGRKNEDVLAERKKATEGETTATDAEEIVVKKVKKKKKKKIVKEEPVEEDDGWRQEETLYKKDIFSQDLATLSYCAHESESVFQCQKLCYGTPYLFDCLVPDYRLGNIDNCLLFLLIRWY